MSFPNNKLRTDLQGNKFEIVDKDKLITLVVLHMIIYRKEFKSSLKWAYENTKFKLIKRLSLLFVDDFKELRADCYRKVASFNQISRNKLKEMYREMLR